MNAKDLLQLRKYLSLAEHVPGKARIKIDPRILAFPHLSELKNLGRQYKDETLASAKFNLLSLSLDVSYDTERIRPEMIDGFLTNPDDGKVMQEALEFAAMLGIEVGADTELL